MNRYLEPGCLKVGKLGMDRAIYHENESGFNLAIVHNGGNEADTQELAELFAAAPKMLAELEKINETIFAAGAPLGSAKYFEIRERCLAAINAARPKGGTL